VDQQRDQRDLHQKRLENEKLEEELTSLRFQISMMKETHVSHSLFAPWLDYSEFLKFILILSYQVQLILQKDDIIKELDNRNIVLEVLSLFLLKLAKQ
jgi:hypothetical protein